MYYGPERRNAFRINDEIALHYEALSDLATAPPIEELEQQRRTFFSLEQQLEALEMRSCSLAQQIESQSPLLGRYLKVLNEKIQLIGKALNSTPDLTELPLQTVNLSETGLAFFSQASFPIGQTLQFKLGLRPSYIQVLAYGQVVSVISQEERQRIGVSFTDLSPLGRKNLARHLLTKQIACRLSTESSS